MLPSFSPYPYPYPYPILFSLSLSLALPLSACSPSAPSPQTPSSPSAPDAGPSPSTTTTVRPVGPPVAERPVPPLSLGSRVARVRGRKEGALGDPLPLACTASSKPAASPPAAEKLAAQTAASCFKDAKPTMAPLAIAAEGVGTQVPLQAQSGACYRLAVAITSGIESFVISAQDSKGAIIAEEGATRGAWAFPSDGPICFEANDSVWFRVSPGRGKGHVAFQILQDK